MDARTIQASLEVADKAAGVIEGMVGFQLDTLEESITIASKELEGEKGLLIEEAQDIVPRTINLISTAFDSFHSRYIDLLLNIQDCEKSTYGQIERME